ncbi:MULTISPECIES: hypothetical protein [Curtobacterium]|nr:MULTISPECIES: hypothetical protein [Curtobacterium]MDD1385344.1 hypothetical protein [Curtobacterium flaccumfaciens pv. poinsettiae]MDQ0537988.1 hypothetical protein [Curtobacterium flaccumfaciens]WNY32876.1 hypothetical protein Q9Q99_11180 [Curtobacterium flaccumfaciens]
MARSERQAHVERPAPEIVVVVVAARWSDEAPRSVMLPLMA